MACFFFGLGAYAQALGVNGTPPKPSIGGTVTDETTGEPLRKAYLKLSPRRAQNHNDPNRNIVAISDAKGDFSFKDLEPGDYSLSAQKPGYLATSAEDLQVSETHSVTDVRVRLLRLSTISVHVLDPDGDPIPFTAVAFYRLVFKDGKRRLQATQSYAGDEPELTPHFLEPGRYYIAASAENSSSPVSYLPTWYPNALDAASASVVSLAPGQNISGLEIRLRTGVTFRIRGVVTGLPVLSRDARPYFVIARRQSTLADDPSPPSGQVGAKGVFELRDALPGTYEIQVSSLETSYGGYASTRLGTSTVQVGNGDLDGITVAASVPRTVTLQIKVEGVEPVDLSRVRFLMATTDGEYQNLARELDGGRYEVQGIGVGQQYVLHLLSPQDVNLYVKSIRAAGAIFPDRLIDAGQVGAEPLEVVLSTHGGSIHGTVNEGDVAVDLDSHITVVLVPDTNDAARRERDAVEASESTLGSFTIRNIAPGKYILFAWRDLPDGAWKDEDFWREMKSEGTPLVIAEDETKQVRPPLISPDRTKALLDKLDIH